MILGVLSQDTPTKDQLRAFRTENKMEYPILYSAEKLESAFDDLCTAHDVPHQPGREAMCAKRSGARRVHEAAERSIKALL